MAQRPALAQPPKGVVDPRGAAGRIRLARYAPSGALAAFVEHYWIVEWDMRGRTPETQRVLPYPNANLAFDRGNTALFGVMRGVFDRQVEGEGRVLGVKFLPGGLRPYLDCAMARITDRVISAAPVIGERIEEAEDSVLSAPDDAAMVAATENLMLRTCPEPDPTLLWLRGVIASAAMAHGPVSVEALSAIAGCSVRHLQRVFFDYVGVTPKWVIRRFRIQEAAWRLAQNEAVGLACLAAELGYFDQAHLSRDFARFVGTSPARYRQAQQGA